MLKQAVNPRPDAGCDFNPGQVSAVGELDVCAQVYQHNCSLDSEDNRFHWRHLKLFEALKNGAKCRTTTTRSRRGRGIRNGTRPAVGIDSVALIWGGYLLGCDRDLGLIGWVISLLGTSFWDLTLPIVTSRSLSPGGTEFISFLHVCHN
ncbi:hypothetical protein pipiens_012698 [Culex pipiens pipiens]|uniref:Uncharacterized protein n=1 Tax=Culex pipiens pipiens TaxID=38569 RepID=A0ABD1D1G4_CULPP